MCLGVEAWSWGDSSDAVMMNGNDFRVSPVVKDSVSLRKYQREWVSGYVPCDVFLENDLNPSNSGRYIMRLIYYIQTLQKYISW